jgi:hypothetical protein
VKGVTLVRLLVEAALGKDTDNTAILLREVMELRREVAYIRQEEARERVLAQIANADL